MEVLIQRVQTTWTKASRGGPLAAIRNAAPVGFPLPSTVPPFVHEVWMWESEGFRPLHRSNAGLPDATGNSRVLLRVEDDGRLRVQLELVPFGIPNRKRRPPAVRLNRGEWLRWQVNYRFAGGTGGDQWTYRLDTLNIAFGEVAADTFTRDPARHVDERTRLR
jgi:hypothetical protein